MQIDILDLLQNFGLSKLEALIYTLLLKEADVTGYRIAQNLNKQFTNVYKALDSLQKKGAVVSIEGKNNRVYSAVPIKDYLEQVERGYAKKKDQIINYFDQLKHSGMSEAFYRIENVDQVYEQSLKMIGDAEDFIALDVCPRPLQVLKDALLTAANTKKILAKVYAPVSLAGCEVIQAEFSGSPAETWPMDWIQLIADGQQYIAAMFEKKTGALFQALWCKSTFFSLVAYNGFFAEFALTRIIEALNNGSSGKEVMDLFSSFSAVRPQNISAVKDYILAAHPSKKGS